MSGGTDNKESDKLVRMEDNGEDTDIGYKENRVQLVVPFSERDHLTRIA